MVAMVAGGFAIAVVSLADTSVLSRTFALRAGTRVNQDQELLALGAANVGAAFVSGFPISASTSRTPVAEAAGGKTQLTGIVGALAILALLVFAPALTTYLPQPTLAAIVIVACTSLVDVAGLRRLWRLRRSEAILSIVAFLGVALVGVVAGIFVAVGLALAAFFWRAWRPYSAILGRVDGVKGYHDVTRYPEARQLDGLILFRWDAPLFFANAEAFREQIEAAIEARGDATRWVVVAAEPVTDMDTTAADMLDELHHEPGQARASSCGSPSSRTRSRTGCAPTGCSSAWVRTRSTRPSGRRSTATSRRPASSGWTGRSGEPGG